MQCSSCRSDFQVQKLLAQIKDWEDCPTTDPQTKRAKVDKLQTELASVQAADEKKDRDRGRNLDVSA